MTKKTYNKTRDLRKRNKKLKSERRKHIKRVCD